MTLTLFLLLPCLLPAQEARCSLHVPHAGYQLRLVDVRRVGNEAVALWSADVPQRNLMADGGISGGPQPRCEARVIVFTRLPVRVLVQGVDWGWWKIGDAQAVESMAWERRQEWARDWERGKPIQHRGVTHGRQ